LVREGEGLCPVEAVQLEQGAIGHREPKKRKEPLMLACHVLTSLGGHSRVHGPADAKEGIDGVGHVGRPEARIDHKLIMIQWAGGSS
jgi:hypothetical protein